MVSVEVLAPVRVSMVFSENPTRCRGIPAANRLSMLTFETNTGAAVVSDVLVHDWIEKNGGAEKVLDSLVGAFPDADVLTLWNDAPNRYPAGKVRESPLAKTPLRGRKALSVPFQALAWPAALVGKSDVDRIIVSSHLFAHHVGGSILGASIPKYVYVHTPARYIWEPELDGRGCHPLVRAASVFLRPIDKLRAAQATSLAANSEFVRQRIQRCWDMDSTVIYPPVDTRRIRSVTDWQEELTPAEAAQVRALPKDFLLGASRFVPYKRLDLVIKAGELVNTPVVLAGAGPDLERLRHIAQGASVPVVFIDAPSDALLFSLYQLTKAFIFPPVEDFGIMPVEAMAAGAPVLCNSEGGAGESVARANVGARTSFYDPLEIKIQLEHLLQDERVNPALMDDFAPANFQRRVHDWVEAVLPTSNHLVTSSSARVEQSR